MAIDSAGNVAYDPSANVLSLVEAANRRQDDLREAERRFFAAEIAHVKEMAALREEHQARMDAAESGRIDSVRSVDIAATATTAAQAQTAIKTLADVQLATAETLRQSMANTAKTIADQFAATVAEQNKRLSALEQASYRGMGKQEIADPAAERLAILVEKLATSQTATTGKSAGISAAWAAMLAAVMLALALAGFFATRGGGDKPSVTYVPVPAGVQSTTTPAGAKPP